VLFRSWRAVLITALLASVVVAMSDDESSPPWVERVQAPQYFAIYVEDVDKSVDWYCSVFGLQKLGGSAAEDGAWRIENLGNEQLLVEVIYDSRAQAVERAIGFRKVGFYVADVEAVAKRIAEETGEQPRIVDFEEMSQRILQLRDPEGNTVQLFSVLEEH